MTQGHEDQRHRDMGPKDRGPEDLAVFHLAFTTELQLQATCVNVLNVVYISFAKANLYAQSKRALRLFA